MKNVDIRNLLKEDESLSVSIFDQEPILIAATNLYKNLKFTKNMDSEKFLEMINFKMIEYNNPNDSLLLLNKIKSFFIEDKIFYTKFNSFLNNKLLELDLSLLLTALKIKIKDDKKQTLEDFRTFVKNLKYNSENKQFNKQLNILLYKLYTLSAILEKDSKNVLEKYNDKEFNINNFFFYDFKKRQVEECVFFFNFDLLDQLNKGLIANSAVYEIFDDLINKKLSESDNFNIFTFKYDNFNSSIELSYFKPNNKIEITYQKKNEYCDIFQDYFYSTTLNMAKQIQISNKIPNEYIIDLNKQVILDLINKTAFLVLTKHKIIN